MGKNFYKGYHFRFKDKEKYKDFISKSKIKNDMSIQEFFEKAIDDYLSGNYNPKK